MKVQKTWLNFSFFNLFILALLGMLLRSKAVFSIPFIDYNHLVEAHGHFAFGGWLILSLTCLLVYELLPAGSSGRAIYQWLFGRIVLCSWAILFGYIFQGNGLVTKSFSVLLILVSYVFGIAFVRDIWNAGVAKSVRILAVSAIVSLILSSVGIIILIILFAIQSLNAIYYRDALYTYLHFQYNGFFTLSVFALLFHRLIPVVSPSVLRKINRFTMLLSLSVIPSLFLSYLWHDPRLAFRIIAFLGSGLVFLSFIWFVLLSLSVRQFYKNLPPMVRFLGILSMFSFGIKEFLQGFTIFPAIGDAVFG